MDVAAISGGAPLLAAISNYMIMFDSTERPHVFLGLAEKHAEAHPESIWRALHDEWNGFEVIPSEVRAALCPHA